MSMKHVFMGASALAIAVATMPAAHATQTTTVFGGGGTLAAKLYRDAFNCYSSQTYGIYATSLGNPATAKYPAGLNAKCTAQQNTSVALAYEPVGSGAGLSAFTSGSPSLFGLPSASNPVAWVNTSAVVATPNSSTPYPEVEFAGSDAYLSSTQITAANAIDAGAAIFQIPTVATPIAVPVGSATGAAARNLLTSDVCDLFSGQEALSGTAQTVVVRADGSGTSFIFSDWLSKNCIGSGKQGKAYAFTSANGFPSTLPNWAGAKVGSITETIVSATGSGGVATAIAASTGSVGYLSPDYTSIVTGGNANVVPAALAVPVTTGSLTYFKPTVPNTSTHIAAVATPTSYSNTIGMTLNEALTAKALSGKGYAIVGFTFVDTYGCYSAKYAGGKIGSAAKGTLLKTFLTATFNGGTFSTEASNIIQASGFAPLSGALSNLLFSSGGPLSSTGINGTQCPAGRT